MTRFSLGIFFSGLCLLGALFPCARLYAQNNPGGLTVSPAFQEITLDQKDTERDFSVSITNTTEMSVTLRIAVFDFGSLDESGGVAFLGASNDLGKKYALASWMRPEKDVITLRSGETGKILVTVENREGLSPGGHYGALTFKTEDDARGDNTGDAVSVNQLFSTLIFVKKVGGEIYNLELKESEYKNNPVRFQDTLRLRFQNSGNVHVVPRGIATVTDPLGRVVAKGIINEESALILPETFRAYPVRLAPLAVSFIPGRYTMKVGYRYDGKDDFSTVSFRFYFIPLPAALACLALVVCGWYVIRRQRNTRGKKTLTSSIPHTR